MTLMRQPVGNFSFLPASGALFSYGVRADAGYHIVHTVLQAPVPFREGFDLVDRHLSALGRPRAALCGVELRCARPYTAEQWAAPEGFNAQYVALVQSWGVFVDGHNPVARTNVAPTVSPPVEQVLYAFSYTMPAPQAAPTFVLAGAAEAPTVRPGETTPDAIREKTAHSLAAMEDRMAALGVAWGKVTACDAYATHDVYPVVASEILTRLGPVAIHGIHWFPSRPPVDNLEIEVDLRGVEEETRLLSKPG